jgi:hypothetical protein
MDLAVLAGKRLALWLTDESNESAIFTGTMRWGWLHIKPRSGCEADI